MDRKLTFPYRGVLSDTDMRAWINQETGVRILKSVDSADPVYYISRPTLRDPAMVTFARVFAMAEARKIATRRAALMRKRIAEAYDEAVLENEGRAIRHANEMEQIEAWFARHDIELGTSFGSRAIIAARDADHEEALAENEFASRFGI